jgi:DMSO/TMAO reductase YedYZ molybdopterin-dependent catalytic subunit
LFLCGVIGGIVATLIQFFGAMLLGLPFPPEGIFQLLISPVPGSIQSVAVENLGEYAKYSAFTSASVGYVLLYGVIGMLAGYAANHFNPGKQALKFVFALSAPSIIALWLENLVASSVSALSTVSGWISAAALILLANAGYSTILVKYSTAPLQVPTPTPHPITSTTARTPTQRRGFLAKAAVLAAAAVAAVFAAKVGLSIFSGQPVVGSNTPIPVNPQTVTASTTTQTLTPLPSQSVTSTANLPAIFMDPRIGDLLNSEVTDTRIFYRVDIDPLPPQLDFGQWALNIHGKVSNPLTINKTSLLNMPAVDEYSTFECVSNTINPPAALISNGKWTGVQMSSLLNQAGPTPDAKYVIFRSADGYSVGIPLDRAMHPQSLLAYRLNDNDLPTGHGFPVRAVIPGLYGMMSAKWVTDIEVTDQVYLGYWQERGWSNDAVIKTTSIVYYPTTQNSQAQVNQTLPIAGIAFAGDRGISKVEVSVDGGQTWNEAYLKPPLSPYSWVLWAYPWTPTQSGNYNLTVRATDGTGQLQVQAATNPYPNGATGYNQLQVAVQ